MARALHGGTASPARFGGSHYNKECTPFSRGRQCAPSAPGGPGAGPRPRFSTSDGRPRRANRSARTRRISADNVTKRTPTRIAGPFTRAGVELMGENGGAQPDGDLQAAPPLAGLPSCYAESRPLQVALERGGVLGSGQAAGPPAEGLPRRIGCPSQRAQGAARLLTRGGAAGSRQGYRPPASMAIRMLGNASGSAMVSSVSSLGRNHLSSSCSPGAAF